MNPMSRKHLWLLHLAVPIFLDERLFSISQKNALIAARSKEYPTIY